LSGKKYFGKIQKHWANIINQKEAAKQKISLITISLKCPSKIKK